MKIRFGLNYSSNAYINLKKRKGILMDESVVNLSGLVSLLEMYAGIHTKEMNTTDRQALYHECLSKSMQRETAAQFKNSWELNSLAVSNEFLKWRDALVEAGWKAEMKQESPRLTLLSLAEKDFCKSSVGDRLTRILALGQNQQILPPDSQIIVAASKKEMLHPTLIQLLDLLESQGVKVDYDYPEPTAPKDTDLYLIQKAISENKVPVSDLKGDGTFEVWQFENDLEACRYVATLPTYEFDVYVNADNKVFDNVQRMLGEATSGSSMNAANPQIVQIFKLGMSLWQSPMNIRNILSWLLLPMHPLKSDIRHRLARNIMETNGYGNKTCQETIKDYLEAIPDKKKRLQMESDINTLIPIAKGKDIDLKQLKLFVNTIHAWSLKMLNIPDMETIKQEQFSKIAQLTNALYSLLLQQEGETIEYKLLESWVNNLNTPSGYSLYESQACSRMVVSNPGDMVDIADSTMWMDCRDYLQSRPATSFLNKAEMDSLTNQGCHFYEEGISSKFAMEVQNIQLLKTHKKAVILQLENTVAEISTKHPVIIKLEKLFAEPNWKQVLKHPVIVQSILTKTAPIVVNTNIPVEMKFKNKELITMRERESSSSLDLLIQHPFDYVMQYMLKLHSPSSNNLSDILTVKGLVAHAVIAELFNGTAQEIRTRIKDDYQTTLDQVVGEQGAILLLQENLIEKRMFTDELKENLETLCNIIEENQLEVLPGGNEMNISNNLDLSANEQLKLVGLIDCVLRDKEGKLIVVDFKWSTSDRYPRILEENTSLQLALYKYMLTKQLAKQVSATAYFVMPRHKLYTTSDKLKGRDVQHVTPINNDDLIDKVAASYRFRRTQLKDGVIEFADNRVLDDFPYGQQQTGLNLFPAAMYENRKSSNIYSIFKTFKEPLK